MWEVDWEPMVAGLINGFVIWRWWLARGDANRANEKLADLRSDRIADNMSHIYSYQRLMKEHLELKKRIKDRYGPDVLQPRPTAPTPRQEGDPMPVLVPGPRAEDAPVLPEQR